MLQDTWHKIEVNLGFGELGPLLEWVKNNSTSNWNYEILATGGKDAGVYKFYFKEDRDAVAFTLWNK